MRFICKNFNYKRPLSRKVYTFEKPKTTSLFSFTLRPICVLGRHFGLGHRKRMFSKPFGMSCCGLQNEVSTLEVYLKFLTYNNPCLGIETHNCIVKPQNIRKNLLQITSTACSKPRLTNFVSFNAVKALTSDSQI